MIECTRRGEAWLIGSDMGRMIERAKGLCLKAQFGALDEAAQLLGHVRRARIL